MSSAENRSADSKTRSRLFTQRIVSSAAVSGMSCGRTARPPRRAIVSAIRRPDTAVMFAATMGVGDPVGSVVVRSTSKREVSDEELGTRNTSEYVRS